MVICKWKKVFSSFNMSPSCRKKGYFPPVGPRMTRRSADSCSSWLKSHACSGKKNTLFQKWLKEEKSGPCLTKGRIFTRCWCECKGASFVRVVSVRRTSCCQLLITALEEGIAAVSCWSWTVVEGKAAVSCLLLTVVERKAAVSCLLLTVVEGKAAVSSWSTAVVQGQAAVSL